MFSYITEVLVLYSFSTRVCVRGMAEGPSNMIQIWFLDLVCGVWL
jgi:hypothetical protein